MITVYCINKKGTKFTKTFDSLYKARVFILRCRYGHNVYVEGYTCESEACNEELVHIMY